jgi:hypothetical protein
MLTDYLLALVTLTMGVKLFGEARRRGRKPMLLFAIGFLCVGAAAVTGGTFHGFSLYLNSPSRSTLWNLTIFLIGCCGGFMVGGGIAAEPSSLKRSLKWLLGGILVTLAGFGIQQSSIGFKGYLNHNDLFHLTQLIAFFFLYRLARNLR